MKKSAVLVQGHNKETYIDMDVSDNSGTPKSSILMGFSIINHPFWGVSPYFWGNTHISITNKYKLLTHFVRLPVGYNNLAPTGLLVLLSAPACPFSSGFVCKISIRGIKPNACAWDIIVKTPHRKCSKLTCPNLKQNCHLDTFRLLWEPQPACRLWTPEMSACEAMMAAKAAKIKTGHSKGLGTWRVLASTTQIWGQCTKSYEI